MSECRWCEGTGTCPRCRGWQRDEDGPCIECSGDGKCPGCSGDGRDHWDDEPVLQT